MSAALGENLLEATNQMLNDVMPDGVELLFCTGPLQVHCQYVMVLSCRRANGKLSQALVADKMRFIQAYVQDSRNELERGSLRIRCSCQV